MVISLEQSLSSQYFSCAHFAGWSGKFAQITPVGDIWATIGSNGGSGHFGLPSPLPALLLFGLLAPFLGIDGPDESMVTMANTTQFPILLFLGVAIGAPLVEEFMFRGALWRGWRASKLGLRGNPCPDFLLLGYSSPSISPPSSLPTFFALV